MTAASEPSSRPSRLRRFAGGLDALLDRLAEPRGFAAAAVGYYAVAFLIRTLLLTGTSGDEAQLMLYGQGFAWIYDFGNPPMAGWLAAIVETVIGPSIAVALLIRYGLMAVFLVLMHAAAREVFEDRRTALAVALSAFGFWFYGWEALRNYMDSLVLIAALAACVWLMLRLARAPSLGGYAGLAVAVAVGSLGKFSFPPVLLALVAAAGVSPLLRETLWSRRGLLAIGAGFGLASPPYVYALLHLDRWLAVADDRLVISALAEGPVGGTLDRALLVPDSALNFVLPVLPLFVVLFLVDLVQLRRPAPSGARRRVRRWLGLWLAALWVLFTLTVVAAGMVKLREHYMFVAMPLPLLLFALLPEQPLAHAIGARWRSVAYCGVLAALAAVALVALAGQAVVEAIDCSKCRMTMPWRLYAERLREAGFERGTIVSYDSPYTDAGANLRRFLPDSRVVSDKRPYFVPPPLVLPGSCLVIWNDSRYPQIADQIRSSAVPQIGGPVPDGAVFGRLEGPLVRSGNPAPTLGYAFIEAGAGDCR
ncbi:hypothetical protein GCM10017083_51460 [Thalassobaculum fulvum]|uniref:Glycosyltransferase RgtA/B/C/D-like domain-containing protein n=1 Tax=Thalassobaculum fulvum TaxID=1633335 RepID=A0A919CS46_9PROT|nr:glycosyltransferase family 39 protein [Thalassobaculum fulvum]GHD62582.1 hypothetical protein GCM10017083_51460 [Thalassobaculum fulvum]